jgi:hypothetical protein
VGTVSVAGCDINIGYEKHVYDGTDIKEGVWGTNSFNYPSSTSDSRIRAECRGDALNIKHTIIGHSDNERLFTAAKPCQDHQLTPEDNILPYIFKVAKGYKPLF